MREFIYVSERKLARFAADRPKVNWWRRFQVAGEVQVPLLGKVAFSQRDVDHVEAFPALDEVTKFIDDMGRTPTWLEPNAIKIGDWFYFECRLKWLVVEGEPPTVLFLADHRKGDADTNVSLFLHGAADHLLSRPPTPKSNAFSLKWLRGTFSAITSDPWKWVTWRGSDTTPEGDVRAFLSAADKKSASLDWIEEAYVSGYARLTNRQSLKTRLGVTGTCMLVATPLYVEYERASERHY
jgi:hypothetical protein